MVCIKIEKKHFLTWHSLACLSILERQVIDEPDVFFFKAGEVKSPQENLCKCMEDVISHGHLTQRESSYKKPFLLIVLYM